MGAFDRMMALLDQWLVKRPMTETILKCGTAIICVFLVCLFAYLISWLAF